MRFLTPALLALLTGCASTAPQPVPRVGDFIRAVRIDGQTILLSCGPSGCVPLN